MSSGSTCEKKGLKRKLVDANLNSVAPKALPTLASEKKGEPVVVQVRHLINAVETTAKSRPIDRSALRRATHALADIAKQEDRVDTVVAEGGIKTAISLLTLKPSEKELASKPWPTGGYDDVQKEACFVLGLLAIKPEFQHQIADEGALPGLVSILKTYVDAGIPTAGAATVRRAADAITNLAHENVVIKSRVRAEGGIPPLVKLLESLDAKVQRAAAGALRTLAFKNEDNKNQIVEHGALPTLIQMLRSEDQGIHYEAVGVIGNLVHSSQHIKKRVLEEGALQPVIGLLSSKCAESQREAALLLGQFATTEPDYKAKIVQRGAVPPLVDMLQVDDMQLREMAAFALGRLAQNAENQAGVVQAGGLAPLLDLLDSQNGNLQHNAAFALYGLADNEDNIADMIRTGAVQRLLECKLIVQASKDCVQKTVKRLEEKVQGKVLSQVLYMMQSAEKKMVQRTATALARLGRETDLCHIFVNRKCLDTLFDMLQETKKDACTQREAAGALFELAKKAHATAPIDCVPSPPTPQVYLGEKFVNNPTMADVVFLVEGKEFHAHRVVLLASSDTFRAMFDGHYREKEASTVPIPNISWQVFEAMMRCIYTGTVEVDTEIAEELLQAADQYMLEGLKRLCEMEIAQALTVENLDDVYELAENFNAPQLGKRCVLYALEHYDDVVAQVEMTGFATLMQRMVPKLKSSLVEQLQNINLKASEAAANAAEAGSPPPAPV